jgi:Spy/CpxP family protein refolding chaperone
MKTWTKVAVVAGVVIAAAATGAFAFGRQMHGAKFLKHMIAARVSDAEDYVQATPAQRLTIDASKDAIIAKLEAHIQAHQADRAQWQALLAADTLDQAAIYAKIDAKAEEMKAAAREIVPEIAKIHASLTKDQRAKLIAHIQAMHGRGHGHPDGGPGQGGFGGPPPPGEE